MSTKRDSNSLKACCFCNSTENNEVEYGKFYEHNGIVTHYYCLLLSSNMEQKGQDDEGILGFLAEDIQKELRRGKRLVCSYCKKIGATLGCCNVRCKRIFHFPCGLKAGSLHQFFGEFKSFCINHRPKQNIDSHILQEACSKDNLICYICYDKVNPIDQAETLWAPCCKKDAWFHRKCVQQLAISAGYFFKCPLCNNKKDFLKVMQEYGIFVPSQDASWELVPNAFEELLYRHDQCDAALCQCPKGRKHTSNNAKWELVLCRTCGSQGIHMACGQLKWANPIWDCIECTSILCNKNNENSSSSSSSPRDSDSDTDISVGTEFPISYSYNFRHAPPSSSSSESEIKLRPGPRSFKLQQQMQTQQTTKQTVELTCFNRENKTNIINAKDADNLKNDIVKRSSINNENISQQTTEENNIQKNDEQNDSQKQRPSVIKLNGKNSNQKIADVITLESDDDDDDVKIILSTRKTLSQSQLQQSNKSQGVMDKSVSAESNAALINCPKTSIHQQNSFANNDASATLKESNTTLSQISMLNSVSLNDENTNTVDSDKDPTMNIKITNVTSLPPEVFENEPDVICENIGSAKTIITPPKTEAFENYVSLPLKRSMYEASSVADNNYKKIKGNSYDTNDKRDTFTESSVVAALDVRQNKETSSIKSSEIREDVGDPSIRISTSADESFNLSTQSISEACKMSDLALNNDPRNDFPSFYKKDEKLTDQFKSHSEKDNTSYNMRLSKETAMKKISTDLHITKHTPQLSPTTSDLIKLDTSNQNTRHNKVNDTYAALPCTITLVQTRNNTVNNNETTTSVNQDIPCLKAINPTVYAENNNQTEKSNRHKTVPSTREKVNATQVSNPGLESPSKIHCDGAVGTSCAESKSTCRRKRRLPGGCNRGTQVNVADSQSLTRNVFLQVTSNYNTCHHPRLIPQYMDLDDLKFRCESDNIQMILYDTFSVNISIKNPKESKKRSTSLTPSKEYALASRNMRGEASSSIDYIVEQRVDKFYRSLKNENHLVNDKAKCLTRSHDDAKENLDPFKSKTSLPRNDIFNNSLLNDSNNAVTPSEYIRENDSEMQRTSNNTNPSTFNRKICNINVDNIVDDRVEFVRNDYNPTSPVNHFEDVQQIFVTNVIPESKDEKISDDKSFCEITDKIECSIDFGLNIISTNKNVENVLQDNIFFMNKHVDNDGDIRHDYTDDSSVSWNDKRLSNIMDVVRLKPQNRSRTNVTNVVYNEHKNLNKQINTCDAEKFIRCTFHENIENNSENNVKHNVESCFKVSIDLHKIRNLIDTKPELFINQKHNNDNQQRITEY